jgi:hypothetical protein
MATNAVIFIRKFNDPCYLSNICIFIGNKYAEAFYEGTCHLSSLKE